MVTGTDQQTQEAIDAGVLTVLPRLLRHTKPVIQKEAAWTLSNIAAGPCQQIQQIITCGLLPPLVELLNKVREGTVLLWEECVVQEAWDGSFVKHSAPKPPEQAAPELLRSLGQPEHPDLSVTCMETHPGATLGSSATCPCITQRAGKGVSPS